MINRHIFPFVTCQNFSFIFLSLTFFLHNTPSWYQKLLFDFWIFFIDWWGFWAALIWLSCFCERIKWNKKIKWWILTKQQNHDKRKKEDVVENCEKSLYLIIRRFSWRSSKYFGVLFLLLLENVQSWQLFYIQFK